VTAAPREEVSPALGPDAELRAWLLTVHDRTAGPVAAASLQRRVTLPLRAARRFRTLVSELGFSQAAAVSAEYAGRRLRRRP
jgi:hypothetical protein